jgi:hypothetical protein
VHADAEMSRLVTVISRRVVRTEPPPAFTPDEIHLIPWDLAMLARALGCFYTLAGRPGPPQ